MHRKKSWLNSLGLLAATAIATGAPLFPKAANAQFAEYLSPNFDPIVISVPPAQQGRNGICPAFLEPAIDSIVKTPPFSNGRWGILVESLDGQVLYSYNPNSALIPASNVKLLTTAAALQRLSPQTQIRSQSLRQWVTTTNRMSNNNYADVLLRYIGGPQAVRQTLSELGVSANGYRQVDGSGLSRGNSATPSVLVNILKGMNTTSSWDVWYSSLPVAGVNGTLRNRMRATNAQGIVHAKTGTLTGVRALSGYVENPTYGTLVFSILANQSNVSGNALVGAIDSIVLQLAQLTPCE
ncbi:MAG: D-alanyl-D-alanine carboxypeptidase [Cyanobacteriota bacterium]|nr:D-alanyl-D-alanine carboxypeptidase [Cyanobacteriota bacterium]